MRGIWKSHKRVAKLVLAYVGLVIAVMLGSIYDIHSHTVEVTHVFVDGEHIGDASDAATVTEWLDEQLAHKQQAVDTELSWKQEVAFETEQVYGGKTADEAVLEQLHHRMRVAAHGIKVTVDGEVAAIVPSEATVTNVLDDIVDQYAPGFSTSKTKDVVQLASRLQTDGEEGISSAIIQEQIEMQPVEVDPFQVVNADELQHILTSTEEVARIHTVKQGDTLSQIAHTYDLSVSELLQLNPELTEESLLHPGQAVQVTMPDQMIHVQTIARETRTEAIPYETIVKESDSLAKGTSKVKQKGKEGKKQVTVEIININGHPSSERIVAEEVLQQPREEIVVKGTKVVRGQGSGNWVWPASGRVTSGFGQRNGRLHKGIDIAGGGAIRAADHGRVTFAGWDGAYGNAVVIDHGNGYRTRYAHLSSIAVKRGQTVERGQNLGVMGATGNATGVHLHFEMSRNGSVINPSSQF